MRVADTVAAILALLAITCFSVFASANPLSPTPLATTADFLVVGFKCDLVNGKLVCGDKQGGKKQDNDDDDDQPKKSKDKAIPKTCGKKVNCEAGMVKLEKPNQYGACCEAREGLPPPKCKFPGQINPPSCDCPKGTEFLGYKGCVKCVDKCNNACLKHFQAAWNCQKDPGADCSKLGDVATACMVQCRDQCPFE